jgi:hypothetical protein
MTFPKRILMPLVRVRLNYVAKRVWRFQIADSFTSAPCVVKAETVAGDECVLLSTPF